MKSKKLLAVFILVLAAVAAMALVGCDGDADPYEGRVKVTFCLEGAKYNNSAEPIVYYYSFREGTENLIKEPKSFSRTDYVKTNYNFKGWYRNKVVNGDKVTYTDKWDFDKDKVTDAGVTLYACWRQYSFDPGYLDADGNFVSFHTPIYVDESTQTNMTLSAARLKSDFSVTYDENGDAHTFVGDVIRDEHGNVLENGITHPLGDEDLSIKVVGEYIDGEYTVVRTAEELKKVDSPMTNVYLADNIDFNGGSYGGIQGYRGIFDGNGKTVSNFNLSYTADKDGLSDDDDLGKGSLLISLFGMANGATVKNVGFENVSVDINTTFSGINTIYVAPLFAKMTNCTVTDVAFSGTFICTKLPSNFNKERQQLFVAADKMYCEQTGENNYMENITPPNVDDRTGEYAE